MDKNFKLHAFITNLGKYTEGELIGEWVEFPVTGQEYQEALERIGIGQEYEEVFITDYDSNIYGLTENLGEYENVEELNYLAGRIGDLTPEEYEKFNAIMEAGIDLRESKGIQSLINLTKNLDLYEVIPEVTDNASYGRYIIENYLDGASNLPMINEVEITAYLDEEAIGRDASINEMGIFTDRGYVMDNQGKYYQEWDGTKEMIPDEYRLDNMSRVKQMDKMDMIQRLGALETELNIPEASRLTSWYGDYAMYEPKESGISESLLQERLESLEKGTLFIPEKELHPVYQAKGWERYDDGSGRLIDIHGKTLVSYDLATKELMGNKLPFTNHKLYMNYSYDNCSFEIMKRDAVRYLNNNYEAALERANEIAELYRQDEENYFKVSETENPEYPFNVEKINNGRCGFGKLCKNVDEVKEFIETCEREISECAPNELITEEMDINELKQLADDLMFEAEMQGMNLEM